MRSQRRLIGIMRETRSTALIPQIEKALNHTSKRFNVSRSFIIACALADYFGIEEQERYNKAPENIVNISQHRRKRA